MRPGDRVWDIGAHKGYVSMALARRVGPEGRVHSFEPSRSNYGFLRRHLEWHGLPNIDDDELLAMSLFTDPAAGF